MLKLVNEDIWDYYDKGWAVVCTTNAIYNEYGRAVMGAGIARQVRERFRNFDLFLGKKLELYGNNVFYFEKQNIFTFPTKEHYANDSIPELIEQSCKQLKLIWARQEAIQNKEIKVIMTKPGCGNGNLKWEDVYPIVDKYFGTYSSDKFLVADNGLGVI